MPFHNRRRRPGLLFPPGDERPQGDFQDYGTGEIYGPQLPGPWDKVSGAVSNIWEALRRSPAVGRIGGAMDWYNDMYRTGEDWYRKTQKDLQSEYVLRDPPPDPIVAPGSSGFGPGIPPLAMGPLHSQTLYETPPIAEPFLLGLGSGAANLAQRAVPSQMNYDPLRLGLMAAEGRAEERLAELPETKHREAFSTLGRFAPEFTEVADVLAMQEIPGLLEEDRKGMAAATLAGGLLPGSPAVFSRLTRAVRRTGENIPKKGLTGQEWMDRLYRQEDVTPEPPSTMFPERYPVADPRAPRQYESRPRGFAAEEAEWAGLPELLSANPDQVFSEREILKHLEDSGIKLTRTWRHGDADRMRTEMVAETNQALMNQESEYLGPEVRRALEQDPGVAGFEVVLSMDDAAHDELMELFPELMENANWAKVVVNDVYPPRGARIFGDEYDYAELDRLIRLRGWDTDRFLLQAANAEESARSAWRNSDRTMAGYMEGQAILMNQGAEYAATVSPTVSPHGSGVDAYPKRTKYDDASYRIPGESDNYRELTIQLDVPASHTPFTGHFPEKNVLVHVRMSDRVHTNPKTGKEERVLFVEEIQSDWHQKGRREGYQVGGPEEAAAAQRVEDARDATRELQETTGLTRRMALDRYNAQDWDTDGFTPDEELLAIINKYDQLDRERHIAEAALDRMRSGVPDAPYKKTEAWTELAMRDVIDEAVRGGYDRVAWGTGDDVADLYDLRQRLSRIRYNPVSETLEAWDLDGAPVIVEHNITPEQLPTQIGKEAAQRLMDADVDDYVITENANVGDYVITEKTHDLLGGSYFWIEGPNAGTTRDTREAAEQVAKEFADSRFIEGEDLAVGGEGMITFYDEIIPAMLRDYGPNVGGIEIEGISLRGIAEGPLEPTFYGVRQNGPDGLWHLIEVDDPGRGWTGEWSTAGYPTREAAEAALKAQPQPQLGGTNSSFAVTPEMKNIVRDEGQRLMSATGGMGLLGAAAVGQDEQPPEIYGPQQGLIGPDRRRRNSS